MTNETGVISIIYKEPDPKTYNGVVARLGKGLRRFYTGNPKNDYKAAKEYLCKNTTIIMGSSTVDHFQMDGGKI